MLRSRRLRRFLFPLTRGESDVETISVGDSIVSGLSSTGLVDILRSSKGIRSSFSRGCFVSSSVLFTSFSSLLTGSEWSKLITSEGGDGGIARTFEVEEPEWEDVFSTLTPPFLNVVLFDGPFKKQRKNYDK